jgi:Purple acid Phosphatase, N-terminal domain
MRRWTIVVLVASLFPWAVAQTAPNSAPAAASSVRITSGPTVEYADDSLAVVSWTTNLPATSTVHFGTDPRNLDHVAAGATAQTQHRVNIADLSPSTKYYFVVESQEPSGGGVPARSVTESVTTVAAGQPAIQNQKPAAAGGGPAPATNTPTATQSSTTPTSRTTASQNAPAPTSPAAATSPSSSSTRASTSAEAAQRPPQSTTSETSADHASESTVRNSPAKQQVPSGTQITATLDQALSTKNSQVGDSFTATVSQPVRGSGGVVLIPAGSKINGKVSESEQGKTLPAIRGRGHLNVRFVDITFPEHVSSPLTATLVSVHPKGGNGKAGQEGEVTSGTSGKNTAKDVGIGAGVGTLAGLVFGSALKGLAIGAIAGGGYVLATDGKDVELPAQTEITVRLDQNLSVPAAAAQDNAQGRVVAPSSRSSTSR